MGSLMDIRRRVLLFNGLPPKYQRTDFIQAQGDRAVIDTGVPGDNDNLKFDFCFNVDRFITYRGFFTNYESEAANCWRMSEASSIAFLHTHNTRTGSSGTINAGGSFANKKIFVTMDKLSASVTVDGVTRTNAAPTAEGTTNNTTIYINSSRRYAQTRDDVIKWYYFKIFDNGRLIRNYVPCYRKSDNKVGFYDTVHGTFNPSTGTVQFTLS